MFEGFQFLFPLLGLLGLWWELFRTRPVALRLLAAHYRLFGVFAAESGIGIRPGGFSDSSKVG